LTERGKGQAHHAAHILKSHPQKPSLIYSSPLKRAVDTATALQKAMGHEEVFLEADLKEHIMGEYEGKPWSEVVPLLEKKIDPEQGETFAFFYTRVKNILNRLLSIHERPVFVSHGGVWHALVGLYGCVSPSWAGNGTVYHLIPHEQKDRPFPWNIVSYTLDENGALETHDLNSMIMKPLKRIL
jgi:broad specificity phosphatase PhoE